MSERVHFGPIPAAAQAVFEEHRARILARLPAALVEHVGSTALPGASTKGDVDLQVRVPAAIFPACEAALAAMYPRNVGSEHTEDLASFALPGEIDVGVQLTAIGGEHDFFHLLRDRLRADAALGAEYEALKAAHQGGSMDDWRAAKDRFFMPLRPRR